MKIAIIGTGNVGGALAKGWALAGHQIFLGVRNLNNEKLKPLLEFNPLITAHPIPEATQTAEVILIATPPTVIHDLIKVLGDISSKIIIDATNSVFAKPDPFAHVSEALKELTRAPHIVKCFNTTGYENMLDPVYDGQGVDMFVCGDSAEAKAVARQLSLDLGFGEVYDFGSFDKITLMEQFAMAWINLAIMQGEGRNIAFKIAKR
ncbi:MAG: NAD(P)-binding domain-containing protein [Bacteroidota bacterium]